MCSNFTEVLIFKFSMFTFQKYYEVSRVLPDLPPRPGNLLNSTSNDNIYESIWDKEAKCFRGNPLIDHHKDSGQTIMMNHQGPKCDGSMYADVSDDDAYDDDDDGIPFPGCALSTAGKLAGLDQKRGGSIKNRFEDRSKTEGKDDDDFATLTMLSPLKRRSSSTLDSNKSISIEESSMIIDSDYLIPDVPNQIKIEVLPSPPSVTGHQGPNLDESLKVVPETSKQNVDCKFETLEIQHTYFGMDDTDAFTEDRSHDNEVAEEREYCDINFEANSSGSEMVHFVKCEAIPIPASILSVVEDVGYNLPNEEELDGSKTPSSSAKSKDNDANTTIQHSYMDLEDIFEMGAMPGGSGKGNKDFESDADESARAEAITTKESSVSCPARPGSRMLDDWGYLMLTAAEQSDAMSPAGKEGAYPVNGVEGHGDIRARSSTEMIATGDCIDSDLQHSYFGFKDSIL